MALPSSGVIRFSDVNIELGVAANTPRRLSDAAVRTLFAVPSGTIRFSNGLGKSNRVNVTVTLASNTTNYTLGTAQIPGYVAGATDVTLVVNSSVYVYSTNTANAGLTVAALAAGDTVSIVNNGFILGMGGVGATGGNAGGGGGSAMNINRAVSITNNSYIAGGGGGGASATGSTNSAGWILGGGGGGAGGGAGGATNGGAGGGPGSSGSNGGANVANSSYGPGGGGGRILPGTGGAARSVNQSGQGTTNGFPGNGGGSGGGGGVGWAPIQLIPDGQGGFRPVIASCGAGGGGGWGASGGQRSTFADIDPVVINSGAGGGTNTVGSNGSISGGTVGGTPGAGGKAVNLNGNTVTWLANGTRWGAIS